MHSIKVIDVQTLTLVLHAALVMLHVLDERHNNSYNDPILLEFSLFREEIFNRATLEMLDCGSNKKEQKCSSSAILSSARLPLCPISSQTCKSGQAVHEEACPEKTSHPLLIIWNCVFSSLPPPRPHCISSFIHQSVLFHCHRHAHCWERHSHTHLNGCMERALNTQQWGGREGISKLLWFRVRERVEENGSLWMFPAVFILLYWFLWFQFTGWLFPSEDTQTVRYNPLFWEKNPLRLWLFVLFVCVNKTVEY